MLGWVENNAKFRNYVIPCLETFFQYVHVPSSRKMADQAYTALGIERFVDYLKLACLPVTFQHFKTKCEIYSKVPAQFFFFLLVMKTRV